MSTVMRPPLRAFASALCLMLLAALLVTGCQRFAFLYERLDWYVTWKLARYVDLRTEQEQQFDHAFRRLWRWHQREELPRYATELRWLAARVEAPLSAAVVADAVQRSETYGLRVAAEASPGVCRLAATLDEQQIAQIMARLDRENAEFAEKYIEPSESRRRRAVEKRQRRVFERWLGPLEAPQRERLRRWAREREELAPAWLLVREQWQAELGAALALRADPQGCQRLRTLLTDPRRLRSPELARREERAQAAWQVLVADILNAMTPEQRAHLQQELRALAEQLDRLAQTARADSAATDSPRSDTGV